MVPAVKKRDRKTKIKNKSRKTKDYKKKNTLLLNDLKKENKSIETHSNDTIDINNSSTNAVIFNENNESDKDLVLMCGWKNCFEKFLVKQELCDHVDDHILKLKNFEDKYVCLWYKCSFSTSCNNEIARHVHYHAYYTILILEGRKATKDLNIPNCSLAKNLNNIPELRQDFICRWTGCSKSFISITLFFSHVRRHCDFEFESSKRPDKKKLSISCGWENCSKKFTVKYRLQEHILKHTNEKLIGCHVCSGIFRTKTYFTDHCKRQEANNTQEFQCNQCFKYFASEKLLLLHITLHVNGYKCSMCDMTCNSSYTLASHIRYRHVQPKPFKCSFCKQKYVTKNDLVRHILIMHANNTYKCTQIGCSYSSKTSYRLRKHIAEVHNNQHIIYACHCCDMVYNCGGSLSKHLIRKHSFQLPSGHKRFTYCMDENGIYRLQTKRIESLEVLKQIFSPKPSNFNNKSSDVLYNNSNFVNDFFTIDNVEINIVDSSN